MLSRMSPTYLTLSPTYLTIFLSQIKFGQRLCDFVPNLSHHFFISDKVWPMVVRRVYHRYSFTPLPTDFLKAKRPESAWPHFTTLYWLERVKASVTSVWEGIRHWRVRGGTAHQRSPLERTILALAGEWVAAEMTYLMYLSGCPACSHHSINSSQTKAGSVSAGK